MKNRRIWYPFPEYNSYSCGKYRELLYWKMKLNKQESRKRWDEIRNLWCQCDPIGVMSDLDWSRDEYDSYLGPSLRYLEQNASVEEIAEYLSYIVCDYMGLGQTGVDFSEPKNFAILSVVSSSIRCAADRIRFYPVHRTGTHFFCYRQHMVHRACLWIGLADRQAPRPNICGWGIV
jgi:hypothetical protein